MAFIAPESTKAPRKLIDSGNYIARCVSMIEIGTVENTFKGDGSTQHKIRLGWEFPTEMAVFKEDRGPEPFTLGKEYTFSMNEKATLRLDLESWRGKSFTDLEAKNFDIEVLLGKPCMINVIHHTTDKGNVVAKIKAITPLIKGMSCPEQINKTQKLNYAEWDQSMFDSLPDWLKESIQKSREYQKMNEPRFRSQAEGNQALVDNLFEGDDSVPF